MWGRHRLGAIALVLGVGAINCETVGLGRLGGRVFWKLANWEVEEARRKLPPVPDVMSPALTAPPDPDKVVTPSANLKSVSRSITPITQVSLGDASQFH